MALTRDFKETIRARVKRDPGFRKALLREGIENFLSGDVETGKIILRDFINATVGFTKLSDVTHRSAKSLMRMLGPRGNPQARNLFEIVDGLCSCRCFANFLHGWHNKEHACARDQKDNPCQQTQVTRRQQTKLSSGSVAHWLVSIFLVRCPPGIICGTMKRFALQRPGRSIKNL